MPSVITDTSLNSGVVTQNSTIWDYPDTPAPSILNFQAVSTQPLPDRTSTGTGLLSPDLLLSRRLSNFPPSLYNLSPSSSLMCFMSALLGDSGAGQLRKMQTMARLSSDINSTHFYDLDSFYGALFGALRGPAGSLPTDPATGTTFNPYTSLATQDGWDDINAADARFRTRIINLARAITLGGTVPGLQAMAEAILGAECDIYETWSLLDANLLEGTTQVTWSAVEAANPTWGSFPAENWAQIEGIPLYGGLGIGARNEVIIQPRQNYDSSLAGQQQMISDMQGISAVTQVLKPAFALLSVSSQPLVVAQPVSTLSLWADSDYWEISVRVTPSDPSDPAYEVLYGAFGRPGGAPQPVDIAIPQPSPPFTQSQGTQYSYISDVTQVTGKAVINDIWAQPVSTADWETVVFPSGSTGTWKPPKALMSPAQAATARSASSVGLKSSPYTGPRVPVMPAS
jgi:hypothetical protein